MEEACKRVRVRLQRGHAPVGVRWYVDGQWGYWCACGKRCSSRYGYLRHARSHARPFACACGRRFAEKHHLVEHQKVRKHVCWCGYTSFRGLAEHTRTHGAREFACTECDARFKTRGTRRTHMLQHAEERHSCPHCNKRFKRRNVLMTHLELVHDIGKFVCMCCRGHASSLRPLASGQDVCRSCYRQATTVSAEEWAMYLDDCLGTDGLVSEDATLRSLGGRTRRRPDRMYERSGHVEVDECDGNEHAYYTDEDKRLEEIQADPFIAGRPLVVTRFNSDKPANLPLLVAVKKHVRSLVDLPPLLVYYIGYVRDVTTDLPSVFIMKEGDLVNV